MQPKCLLQSAAHLIHVRLTDWPRQTVQLAGAASALVRRWALAQQEERERSGRVVLAAWPGAAGIMQGLQQLGFM